MLGILKEMLGGHLSGQTFSQQLPLFCFPGVISMVEAVVLGGAGGQWDFIYCIIFFFQSWRCPYRLDMDNKQLHMNKGGLHRIIEDLNKQHLINETSWLVQVNVP